MTTKIEHPEWEKENSLTSPSDRDPARTYQPNQGHPTLSENEVKNAMSVLNNNNYVKKFLSCAHITSNARDHFIKNKYDIVFFTII